MITRKGRLAIGLVAVAALAVSLAGCGEEESVKPGGTKVTSSVDASLAAMVPDNIKSAKKIKVGTDATYAPSEFLDTDGKTVIGFDVDLFNAVAQKLGLKVEWTPGNFDDLIAGVESGKYDVGVSSFTINAERMQRVTMVSYFTAGTQWATRKGNPDGINPDDPCGKKIAVQTGTVQEEDITARSKKCKDGGKPEVTIHSYQSQADATAAVTTGKDSAMLADSPVAAYAVKNAEGKLELLGEIYDSAPYGYVLKKDQTKFAEAISGAVKALIADGSYKKILDNWNVSAGAATDSQVNPSV